MWPQRKRAETRKAPGLLSAGDLRMHRACAESTLHATGLSGPPAPRPEPPWESGPVPGTDGPVFTAGKTSHSHGGIQGGWGGRRKQ